MICCHEQRRFYIPTVNRNFNEHYSAVKDQSRRRRRVLTSIFSVKQNKTQYCMVCVFENYFREQFWETHRRIQIKAVFECQLRFLKDMGMPMNSDIIKEKR